MRHRNPWFLLAGLLAWSAFPVLGQQSVTYRLGEFSINAGGRPANDRVASSASYRVEHDAIGDAAIAMDPSSASYLVDVGFVIRYAPTGEVPSLYWNSQTDLLWDAARSAWAYNVYRDSAATLPGGFGQCWQHGTTVRQTVDTDIPAPGEARFYLVTGVNRIDEEGIKGLQSGGVVRGGSVCP